MEIFNSYKEREKKYSGDYVKSKRKGNLLSVSRLIIFLAGIILVYITAGIHPFLAVAAFLLSGMLFFAAIKRHGQITNQQRLQKELIKINEREIKALDGDFSLFDSGSEYTNTTHSFSFDLDLFGDGSLFQYLNRTCSVGGKETLKDWLIHPLKEDSGIKLRQVAVEELKTRLDWRQHFLATGNTFTETGQEEHSILEWTNNSSEFRNSWKLNLIRFLLPAITITLLTLSIFSILPLSFFFVMILAQLMIVAFNLVHINREHRQVTKQFELLYKFAKLLIFIESENFSSPLLLTLQKNLLKNGRTAADQINRLAGIIHRFDRRLDMLIGVLLNGLLMWDIHCVIALDNWKKDSQIEIQSWIDAVKEMDALISLASFSYNNPEYVFPETSNGKILVSEQLGHPLIHHKSRISNNFQIGRKGELVILTGPNMAGKSTFLRTVGVNLVLAMTGAPVCARKFLFTPVKLYSSMRTSDSLRKKESYFYAELRRLKILKENLEQKEKILILLDEILKGTNSQDKQIGSKLFINLLIKMEGTGLIATHDVELGKMENEYPDQIRNNCFEAEIIGEQISFDYILRDGITQRMNAAYLMRQMGIV